MSNLHRLYIFNFLVSLHFMGGVLVPFFTQWGRLSFGQIMLLQSWFQICVFLFEVPTGTIADRFGRKRSLLIACLINSAAAVMYASRPNFLIFMAAETIWALSVSLISGADEALLYDSMTADEKKHSKKHFSRFESFGLAGILAGAPVGSIMAAYLGIRAPMALLVVPLIFAFAIALQMDESKPSKRDYLRTMREGFDTIRKNSTVKILAFDMISIAALSYFIIWMYQPLLINAGISTIYLGFFHALLVASQIAIINFSNRSEKLFNSKKGLALFSALVAGVMFIIGGVVHSLLAVIAVIVIGGGFGLSRRPLFIGIINSHLHSRSRATALSCLSMIARLVQACLNPVAGMLADWSIYNTLIILGVAMVLLAISSRVREEHLAI